MTWTSLSVLLDPYAAVSTFEHENESTYTYQLQMIGPLSLIFPPLFHMGLEGTKGWQRLVDQVLIAFGTGIMLFTLWNTANKWGSQ